MSDDAQQFSQLFFNLPFLPLNGPMERLALSWGKCARQFTKLLLSLLSHIGEQNLTSEPLTGFRSWRAMLRPEVPFREDVAGTGLQISLEMLSLFHGLERDV